MGKLGKKSLFLTTPLYYVNAKPHIGHAYTTVVADCMKRFEFQRGNDAFFLTGTDEHGEKIKTQAEKAGKSPLEFATEIAQIFQNVWKQIGLEPDVFYRTTQPSHYALVSNALAQLKERGEIYFASYSGKYCVGCERFRTDQEWNAEGLCPDHLTPPQEREESNYFFKMGSYQEKLKEFYKKHPDVIQPSFYLNEVLSFLSQPLEDLCISRPMTRLDWGIPLPFDNKYVTYVWFDALLNYPGGLSYNGKVRAENAEFQEERWKNTTHLIGKDILKTHAIYWPTMLMALGLPLFQHLQVGGFWLTKGLKMSKSLGNVVDPLVVKERFGNEPFRYFLLREMSFGGDANFTWELFVNRANADLANGLGNLASRVLTLTHKNFEAKVPSRQGRGAEEAKLLETVHALPARYEEEFDARRFHLGMAAFADTVSFVDRYINDQKPWALAKDPAHKERLGAVLGTAMDALSTLATVGASVLPEAMHALKIALGEKSPEKYFPWSKACDLLPEGRALGEIPRLFPRLELPKEE